MKKSLLIVFVLTLIIISFWVGRYSVLESPNPVSNNAPQKISLVDFTGKKIDWSSPTPKQPTLADMLKAKGIELNQVTHFEFVGDESSYTHGQVKTTDRDEIEWVWTSIFEYAEPYSFWIPSGYRRMNIYTKNNKEPVAKLFVNETEATSIEGVDGRFMCHGLEEYILSKLPKREMR